MRIRAGIRVRIKYCKKVKKEVNKWRNSFSTLRTRSLTMRKTWSRPKLRSKGLSSWPKSLIYHWSKRLRNAPKTKRTTPSVRNGPNSNLSTYKQIMSPSETCIFDWSIYYEIVFSHSKCTKDKNWIMMNNRIKLWIIVKKKKNSNQMAKDERVWLKDGFKFDSFLYCFTKVFTFFLVLLTDFFLSFSFLGELKM